MDKVYACIDLKSFYASVECVIRNLDPLNTNLVVADNSRTEKTICLAISPSLKKYGIKGRARLFEVVQKVREVNNLRRKKAYKNRFTTKSYIDSELSSNNNLEVDYIVAKPQMALYIKYSTLIYNIYLKSVSKDDIFVYSIDEVFIDITSYLKLSKLSSEEFVTKMIRDVYEETGITATGGIGTNMYLAKIAMDIIAKHENANSFGVRIGYLDEKLYREKLWSHEPLSDFWRVGKGIMDKLNSNGIYTMGDIALLSIKNSYKLYKLFGVNAELLIDHAWGYEVVSIKDIKEFKPSSNSISSGQVLHCAYDYKKAGVIVKEMVDLLVLDLYKNNKVTDLVSINIIYDVVSDVGEDTVLDFYGRSTYKPSSKSKRLEYKTSSSKILSDEVYNLYMDIVRKDAMVKKINICFGRLEDKKDDVIYKQFNLFSSGSVQDDINKSSIEKERNEKNIQDAIIKIKGKYGKNAILKGIDLEEGATTIDRNNQIGGHKA